MQNSVGENMMVREVIFTGPAGRLEGKYHQNPDPKAPIAVTLHPHPMHGGTMDNKVNYRIFHTFASAGFSVLRFNFRGVGKSHGSFGDGIGELVDAAAAMDWLQLNHPEACGHWIAGFSFGAWIALQLLMRRPEVSGFIAVSPPAGSYDFSFLSPCPVPGAIVQGTKDNVVAEEDVFNLYDRVCQQRDADLEYLPINGADHFFRNQLDELEEVIASYLESKANIMDFPKKSRKDKKKKHKEAA
jgi:uncharacterized protein